MYLLEFVKEFAYEEDYTQAIRASTDIDALKSSIEDNELWDQQWDHNNKLVISEDHDGLKYYQISKIEVI